MKLADGKEALADSIIVAARPGVAAASIQTLHAELSARRGFSAQSVADVGPSLQRVSISGVSIETALTAYRADLRVLYAEPDFILRAAETPNDPSFPSQWGMTRISAPAAWDQTRGSSAVRIAILDCGIYEAGSTSFGPGHPDINGKVVARANFTSTPDADDYCDHGTHVAGIAAAITNNGVGVAGVGYTTSLMNVKVLDNTGAGTVSSIVSGIYWAADNGARVINMSLGGDIPCPTSMQAAVDYAWSRGVVLVASAGNSGLSSAGSPANCVRVVSVAATDQSDNRANFSNYGSNVNVAAPGVSIYSTNYVGSYENFSGTSQAAPHVAGLAGLLWATSYGASNQMVVARLLNTSDRVAGTGSLWTYGRINAAAAVAPPVCLPRPDVSVSASASSPGVLAVTATATGSNVYVQSIAFGSASNATVNAGPTTASPGGFTYAPPMFSRSATFTVRRTTAGQAATVPLTVTDSCGSWPSFVGGGPSAF
ncbi:MAG: S8 family serine peptidase [Chloroflexi bacterium]|nr:S8 family serine peptidase [Chloroflexota bacterium]